MQPSPAKESRLVWIAFFASTGTLLCCALPIVFVSLGLGAAVAALTSTVPFLITLSKHKAWIFALSGLLLALSAWIMWRPGRQCPSDPKLAALCNRAQTWNRRVLKTSITIWLLGFFAAYLALPLRLWLGV